MSPARHRGITAARAGTDRYCSVVAACPAELTVIAPAQLHMHCELSSSAGTFPIVTLADPGDHGPAITGRHGCGAPSAEATAGLAVDVHIPNPGIHAGPISVMTPAAVGALTD
jgi:hypothetical protein